MNRGVGMIHSALSATLLACFALPSWANGAPPRLDLELTPHAANGAIGSVGVTLRLQEPKAKEGEALLRMPVMAVSVPTMAYRAADIEASDAAGRLALSDFDEPPTSEGTDRQYRVHRATVGDVTVRYTGKPRQVDARTRNGPLYDLRAQGAGLVGAGMYFLALPPGEQPYRVGLKWDLSGLPPGTRGVWSLGEGEQHTTTTAEMVARSAFAIGPVKSLPADGKGSFVLYWVSEPPFDMAALAAETEKLYRYMAKFFKDEDSSYRVFARENPFPGRGGTGLLKSFMFAYGSDEKTGSGVDHQMMLAHEIAHNWPRLNGGESHTDTAWYTEGTAEFYASVLAWRAGAIDLDKFVKTVNGHAAGYASNPYKLVDNSQVGKNFWTDADAQSLPYGRGFMYLMRIDAQLREKSGGKRSLDDLVLEVQARQKAGKQVDNPQWRAIAVRELGEQGGREFDNMVAGRDIVPPANAFAPCLKPVAYQIKPFELGFDRYSFGQVKNLKPDSAAAGAGVREGDKILKLPDLKAARADSERLITVQLQRGPQVLEVSYAPSGPQVQAWRWQRTAAAENGGCAL